MRRHKAEIAALWLAASVGAVAVSAEIPEAPALDAGRAPFIDRRNPPARQSLDAPARQQFDLGLMVFNTPWVVAATPDAARRDGLGPLFVRSSCDGCHNNGARGRGERNGTGLSNSFVMQLGGSPVPYGAVLNTQAIAGYEPEGRIELRWNLHAGRYPDGSTWALREPRYRVIPNPDYAPFPADTVLHPRIAPAVFGTGLLEGVTETDLQVLRTQQPRAQRGSLAWQTVDGVRELGRFGWQAEAVSIEDQTARALAREMGLTSRSRPHDDCTAAQTACTAATSGGTPEVSGEFMDALLAFQRLVAVPSVPDTNMTSAGAALFERTGCSICHQPRLAAKTGNDEVTFMPFTDLLLHDMGSGLADRTASGRTVKSRWRTAPLWGLGHALQINDATLLHDGRARSVEEAILWHDGQGRPARLAFMQLPARDRQLLLDWIGLR